jgi:DNA polymerase III subunit delta'
MVSFIIVAKDKKKRIAYVKEKASEQKINAFDITIIEKDSSKKNSQTIGIEDIKAIQEKLFLKPIKSKSKFIVIEDAQLLTPEAQNALLKVLEEPPANTNIILGTETTEALLQTIQSRCQIIQLEEDRKKLSEKTVEELNLFITSLPDLSISERLKQAELLAKDKDKALLWIENLTLVLREKLLKKYFTDISQTKTRNTSLTLNSQLSTLKSLQSLHTLLKSTNVNSRFAIEQTLLSL